MKAKTLQIEPCCGVFVQNHVQIKFTFTLWEPYCLILGRFLRQKHSWSEIQASEEQFRKIFVFHHVFPAFLDVLLAFGWKTEELEVGYHGFRAQVSEDGSQRQSYCPFVERLVHFGSLRDSAHYFVQVCAIAWAMLTAINGKRRQIHGPFVMLAVISVEMRAM